MDCEKSWLGPGRSVSALAVFVRKMLTLWHAPGYSGRLLFSIGIYAFPHMCRRESGFATVINSDSVRGGLMDGEAMIGERVIFLRVFKISKVFQFRGDGIGAKR